MKICTSSRHTARHCHLVTTASTSLTAVTAATSTCYIFILPSRDILTFCGSCANTNNLAAAHWSCHVVWSVAVSGVTQLPGQVPSWAPGRFWPSPSPPGDEPGSSTGDHRQVSPLNLSQCPGSEQQQHFPKLQQTPGRWSVWRWCAALGLGQSREQIKLSARRFMSQVPQQMYGLAVLNLKLNSGSNWEREGEDWTGTGKNWAENLNTKQLAVSEWHKKTSNLNWFNWSTGGGDRTVGLVILPFNFTLD